MGGGGSLVGESRSEAVKAKEPSEDTITQRTALARRLVYSHAPAADIAHHTLVLRLLLLLLLAHGISKSSLSLSLVFSECFRSCIPNGSPADPDDPDDPDEPRSVAANPAFYLKNA